MHDIRPFLPDLFSQPGSLLYVGARSDAHSWLEELYEVGHHIVILEVWEKNVDGLRSHLKDKNIFITLGNIRELGMPLGIDKFDYIFWWHGPEHLPQNDILSTLQNLESKTNKILALACPWGVYPQGDHEGNPYETHLSTLYPTFFQGLGYNVETDGESDKEGSQIVAWKNMSIKK